MTQNRDGWKTLKSEVAYSCPEFDVVNESVELSNGTETDFDYVDEGESVVILPFTKEDNVVVIEEWRHAVRRFNKGLPAGSADEGDESLEEAAKRELEEETGYISEDLEHMTKVEAANGITNTTHNYFVARDCEPTGDQKLDEDEEIRVGTMEWDQFLEFAKNNRDGRTVLGILYYENFFSD